jgi:hypothetical protein
VVLELVSEGGGTTANVRRRSTASIFVSAEAVDLSPTRELIAALRATGALVNHSPRNPLHGVDHRWSDWYAVGLREALRASDVAILVVDASWSASTWIASEADMAFHELQDGAVATWNPSDATIEAPGVVAYLRVRLPDSLSDAVAEVIKVAGKQTRP